jgi:hypothetical protein
MNGASGTVAGVAATSLLAAPLPTALCAETVTEYSTPFVNPIISQVGSSEMHPVDSGTVVTV